MPFVPGRSGNPGGERAQRIFRDALTASLKRCEGNVERIQLVADRLVDNAIAGDTVAIREIADRIDGKMAQAVEGDVGLRLVVQIVRQTIDETGGLIESRVIGSSNGSGNGHDVTGDK
jgi:hypothetical protein